MMDLAVVPAIAPASDLRKSEFARSQKPRSQKPRSQKPRSQKHGSATPWRLTNAIRELSSYLTPSCKWIVPRDSRFQGYFGRDHNLPPGRQSSPGSDSLGFYSARIIRLWSRSPLLVKLRSFSGAGPPNSFIRFLRNS